MTLDLAQELAAPDAAPPGPFYLVAQAADRDIRVGRDGKARWWYLVGVRAPESDPAAPRYTFAQVSGPYDTPAEAEAAGKRAPLGGTLWTQERAAHAAYGGR